MHPAPDRASQERFRAAAALRPHRENTTSKSTPARSAVPKFRGARSLFAPAGQTVAAMSHSKPLSRLAQRQAGSFCWGLLRGFQNPQHGEYRVPTAGRRRRTKKFVDLPQITDRLHVAAVDSKHQSILQPENSYGPLPVLGNGGRKAHVAATSPRKDAHKPDHIGRGRLSSKRVLHLQSDKITAFAERNFRIKPQLPAQFSNEVYA